MTIGQFENGIRQYFHADPSKFLWNEALIAFGEIMIDIIYLDEFLQERQDYDPEKSIHDNLIYMYGEEAAKFVESLF